MTCKVRTMAGHATWTLATFVERLAFACMGRDRKQPDADPLALVAEFNSLTKLVDSKYRGVCTSTEEHDAELTAAPPRSATSGNVGTLLLHARGHLRRPAGACHEPTFMDSEIRSLADAPDNAHFPFTERMLAALLRDMMAHRSTGQGLGKIETELAQSASRFPA